ncbi:MAG: hypothetical protein LWX83_00070 [Anaerolineae bacterium]|nr:hypothetical protein [Anaerolineae bacterium]
MINLIKVCLNPGLLLKVRALPGKNQVYPAPAGMPALGTALPYLPKNAEGRTPFLGINGVFTPLIPKKPKKQSALRIAVSRLKKNDGEESSSPSLRKEEIG